MTAPYPDQLDGAIAEIGRLAALNVELLAALQHAVRSRNFPIPDDILYYRAVIAKARGVTA